MLLRALALCAFICLVSAQDQCTQVINAHHSCLEQAMQSAPDHRAMKTRVDNCFTQAGCSGTPETFHRRNAGQPGQMGPPPPPPFEMMECVSNVVGNIQDSCRAQLRIPFSFPTPKGLPPPPPPPGPPPGGFGGFPPPPPPGGFGGFPPPPPPGGFPGAGNTDGQSGGFPPPPPGGFGPPPGGHRHGPPDFTNVIQQVCPANVQDTVKQCVDQIHEQTKPQHEQFHQQMQQCMSMLGENQECFEVLHDAREQMCACAQLEARKGNNLQRIQQCTTQAPDSRMATALSRGRVPRMILGPICGPPHPPPPPPGGFGPPQADRRNAQFNQQQPRARWSPRARENFNFGQAQAPPQRTGTWRQ